MAGSKLLWLAVVALVAFGPPPLSAGQVEPADGEELVRQVLLTWTDHEVSRLAGLFAEHGVYDDVPPKMTYQGPDAIGGFMSAIWSWAPDIRFTPLSVVQAGDTVVAEWTMTGTQTGPIGGIPASGKPFTVRGVSVAELEGGRIVRYSDYYDLASILVQFGVRCSAPASFGGTEDQRGGHDE